MHSELIKHATHEQLVDFASNSLSMIKETNHELYDTLEMYLYKKIYGCHFSDWLNDRAVSKMHNADGTMGRHWTVEQTTSKVLLDLLIEGETYYFLEEYKRGASYYYKPIKLPTDYCKMIGISGTPSINIFAVDLTFIDSVIAD